MNQGAIQETTVVVQQPEPKQWLFKDENGHVILVIHLDDSNELHLECAIGAFASVLMKGKSDGQT